MYFEALKRLGLAYMNIDCEKSYESYKETNNNHIINIYLKKKMKILVVQIVVLTMLFQEVQ